MKHDTNALPAQPAFDPMRELPPAPLHGTDWQYEVESRVRKVEARIRARPITTIGAAVLAGFVLGRIVRD
jgi:hypothetical protein